MVLFSIHIYSLRIRNAMYNMSDHLSVILELLTDQVLVVIDENNIENLL